MSHQAPASPADHRRPLLWVTSTLLAVILLAGAAAGAYVLGIGSRPSDNEIEHRLVSQSTVDKQVADAKLEGALEKQRKSITTEFKRRLEKARDKAYANGQAAGYSSGHAAGYGSGSAQGRAEGEEEGREEGKKEGRVEGEIDGYLEGFDEGTCYHPETYEYVC